MEFINGTPGNVDELVKKANDKTSWVNRLEALNELGKYDCQKSRDVITRLTLHDKVYGIKVAAHRFAQGLDINKNGKVLFLGKKDIGYKSSDFSKAFQRVRREAKMEHLELEVFKEHLKLINPEMYDVMLYEKKEKFDAWIKNIFTSLPKSK